MNARIASVVTAATLVLTATGCSGMKNFLFGRGARCGLCTKLTPQFGNMAPGGGRLGSCLTGGCNSAPAAPMYQPAPAYSAAPACGCGVAASAPCMTCSPEPVCGNDGYAPVVNDPYLYGDGSTVVGSAPIGNSYPNSYPVDGQVIDNGVINGGVYDGGVYNGGSINSVPSGSWQQRRVDYDGAKILSEEPLPPGTTPIR